MTTWFRTGSGFDEGCAPLERVDVVADLDGRPEALEAFLRRGLLGDEPLGLARLLEHRPILGELRLDDGPPLLRPGQDVSIALELHERRLALVDDGRGTLDRLLGHLEPAGVLVAGLRSAR